MRSFVGFSLVLAACGGGAMGVPDASNRNDAGMDAAVVDAGSPPEDGGRPRDANLPIDGGPTPDAGRYCEGFEPPSGARECASPDDCMRPLETCLPPDVELGCGIVRPPERECARDGDCPAGVCVEYMLACSDGPSSRCDAACTTSSCAADERCRSDGHCEPVPCSEGYMCAKNFVCSGAGDAHGCMRRTCATAHDCDCGACVGGECHAGPAICTVLPS